MKSLLRSRLFRYVASSCVVLAALFIAGVIFYAEPLLQKAQPHIEQKLKDALGGDISFGELKLSLFPTIHIASEKFVATTTTGDFPFSARVKKIVLYPEILPLLQGSLVINEAGLVSPVITLLPKSASEKQKPAEQTESGRFTLQLDSLKIEDGLITLADKKSLAIKELQSGFRLALAGSKNTDDSSELAITALKSEISIPQLLNQRTLHLSAKSLSHSLSTGTLVIAGGKLSPSGGEVLSFDANLNLLNPSGSVSAEAMAVKAETLNALLQGFIEESPHKISFMTGALSGTLNAKGSGASTYSAEAKVKTSNFSVKTAYGEIHKLDADAIYLRDSTGVASFQVKEASFLAPGVSKPLRASLKYTQPDNTGVLQIEEGEVNLSTFSSSTPVLKALLAPYKLSGTIVPKLTAQIPSLEVSGSAVCKDISVSLPISGAPKPLRIDNLSSSIGFDYGPENHLAIALNTLSGNLPEEAATFKASGNVQPLLGSADLTVAAQTSSLKSLLRSLPDSLTKAAQPYSVDGQASVEGKLILIKRAISKFSGTASLSQISGLIPSAEKEATRFANLRGTLSVLHGGSHGLSISSQGNLELDLGSGAEKVILSGGLRQPAGGALSTTLNIKAPKLTLANVAALIPATLKPIGSVSPDMQLELTGKNLSQISGSLTLSDLSLQESAAVKLSQISSALTFDRTAKGNTLITSSSITANLGQQPIRGTVKAALTPTEIFLDPLKLELWGGSISAELESERDGGQRYRLKLHGGGIDIEKFMQSMRPENIGPLRGTVTKLSVTPTGSRKDLQLSSSGDGSLTIENGVLKGVNIARLVLEKLGTVPLIGQNLTKQIPREFEPYFEKDDTPIQRLEADYQFSAKQGLHLKRLAVASDVYGLTGSGTISYGGDLNLSLTMVCDQDLSTALVRKITELSALRNRDGFLRIPFALQGRYPNVQARPDVESLLKQGAQKMIQDTLIDLLAGGGDSKR